MESSLTYKDIQGLINSISMQTVDDLERVKITAALKELAAHRLEGVVRNTALVTDMGKKFRDLALKNVEIFDKKQQDYGSGNIASFGELGVLVRANDKIERLKNLLWKNQGRKPQNEPIEDAWLDLANYGLIGYMCNKGLWN